MESTVIFLVVIFLALLFIVCGKKGFRSLLSLALTVVILLQIIIPLIIKGYDPTLVTWIAAVPITCLIVYLTEGYTLLSHVCVASVILSFTLTSALIGASVSAAHLIGLTSEDASYVGAGGINLSRLLIAGIMLSTLGVLTEMVVTQVATVAEFKDAGPTADAKTIYRQAYAVGIAHLGSIINTLFLLYAGVLMPLLIIFVGSRGTWTSALNYEPLVSEIIRTLTGTIGLVIAMPMSTALAAWWMVQRGVPAAKKASS